MRAQEFLGTEQHRPNRQGARPRRGHEPVERYHKVTENNTEVAVFEIDSEEAYNQVMDRFGNVIEWSGDYMVAPRKYWPAIEATAFDAGGEAHEVSDEQLNELMFKGVSQCTKDCSGHRAGYEWYQRRGVEPASWSDSFNRGAAVAKAGY